MESWFEIEGYLKGQSGWCWIMLTEETQVMISRAQKVPSFLQRSIWSHKHQHILGVNKSFLPSVVLQLFQWSAMQGEKDKKHAFFLHQNIIRGLWILFSTLEKILILREGASKLDQPWMQLVLNLSKSKIRKAKLIFSGLSIFYYTLYIVNILMVNRSVINEKSLRRKLFVLDIMTTWIELECCK